MGLHAEDELRKRQAETEEGYSSVQITLDVYTPIDADMIKTEFAKVAQM